MQQIDISVCIQPVGDSGGAPFRLLTAFAATFPKGSVLALSVTCGDSSPKGRALGIAAKFSVKP